MQGSNQTNCTFANNVEKKKILIKDHQAIFFNKNLTMAPLNRQLSFLKFCYSGRGPTHKMRSSSLQIINYCTDWKTRYHFWLTS